MIFDDVDRELREYVQEHVIQEAATWGAMLELLTEKGIITEAEFKQKRMEVLAAVEQEYQAMKEKALQCR